MLIIELKNDEGTENIISWKSKGILNSKLTALHGAFLPNVKSCWNKIGIQFNSTLLVVEQNNCATKIGNINIVCDLDNWPKKTAQEFYIKKWFLLFD